MMRYKYNKECIYLVLIWNRHIISALDIEIEFKSNMNRQIYNLVLPIHQWVEIRKFNGDKKIKRCEVKVSVGEAMEDSTWRVGR